MQELCLNVDKTQLIIFKSASKKLPDNINLILDNIEVKPGKIVKLLGVTLDQHLTFGPHIKDIHSRCNGLLGVLGRAVPYLPVELLRLAYMSTIRSILEYCNGLFLSVAQCHLNKLDIIQKKASRIILRQPKDAHAEPLLESLKIDSLTNRRTKHVVNLLSKVLSGRCHPAAKTLMQPDQDGFMIIPPSRTANGRRRFAVTGANLFNDYLRHES